MDLPGLLGEESTAAVGQHAPAKPNRPAWEHSVALRAQLGQTGSPQTGPEHLDCVRVLLQQGAGLQLSQLLQAQAACAALRERKVQLPALPASLQPVRPRQGGQAALSPVAPEKGRDLPWGLS